MFDTKIKIIIWAVLITLLLLIGIFLLFFYRPTLNISVNPPEAIIQIADVIGQGKINTKLKPGKYLLKISLSGYIDLNEEVIVGVAQKKQLEIQLRAIPEPVKISSHQAQFLVFDESRESLLYFEPNHKTIYRLFLNNLENPVIDPITPATLAGINDFNWSPNRQLAFFKKDGLIKQYDFKRYDLINQEIRDWPVGIGSIDWRHDNEKVTYYFSNGGGEKSLIRATKDNSEVERIFNLIDTGIDNPQLSWSLDDKSLLLLTDKIYILDVFSKQLTELKIKDLVKDAVWLADSERILLSNSTEQLKLLSKDGSEIDLNKNGSLDRIVSLPNSSGLIQASNRGNSLLLEKINFTDLSVEPFIFRTELDLFPVNLLLTNDSSRLFFTSEGNIYTVLLDDGHYVIE